MLVFWRSAPMNGGPRSVFTREIRRENCVGEDSLRKGAVLLCVQGMNVEKRDGEDPRDQP